MKKCNFCYIFPAVEDTDKCESCLGLLNHIKEQKKYVIYISRGPDNTERIEKTEEELTSAEKEFFYGQVIHYFNLCPPDIQEKFLRKLLEKVTLTP